MTKDRRVGPRWVDLATARDQLEAEMWCNLLVNEGVSAMVRPGDTSSFLGVHAHPTGVRVLEEDLQRARELLAGPLSGEVGAEDAD